MNNKKLSDKEIYSIVDREISSHEFEAVSHKQAIESSMGNPDLMISRYFLIRVENLKRQSIAHKDKSDALNQRKIEAAQEIIRYRAQDASSHIVPTKENSSLKAPLIFGNIILALSSLGALLAISILSGDTVYSASYQLMVAIMASLACIPFVISKIKLGRSKLSYQTALMSVCSLMCVSSASTGLLLLKSDPPSYVEIDLDDQEPEPMRVNIQPSINQAAVVSNP